MGMMPGCSRRPRAGGTMEQSRALPSHRSNRTCTPLYHSSCHRADGARLTPGS